MKKSSHQRNRQRTDTDVDMGLAGWGTHGAKEVSVRENLTGVAMNAEGEQVQCEQRSEFSRKKGKMIELGGRWEGCLINCEEK